MLSLQLLCLDLIVKYFERFHFAFTVSKDSRVLRNLEFLQRRFSNHLTRELLEDENRTDSYFDFLINEHLTSVDFCWFKNSRYLKSLDDIFRRLPNLLRISYNSCGDEILQSVIKFCPKLVEIDAFDFTDKGIAYLCNSKNGKLPCPDLTNLQMKRSSVSERGATYLILSLPSIEKFSYPELPFLLYSIHTENYPFVPQKVHFFNITELNLMKYKNMPYIAEVLKACVTVCPKLESIFCCLSKKEELDALDNSHLKTLVLKISKGNSNINIDSFIKANGHNLSKLCASNCTLSASALSFHCPALNCLFITNVKFSDDHDLQLSFPSLTNCLLGKLNHTVMVKVFRLLCLSSPKLECITFLRCSLSSELKNQILLWCTNSLIKFICFTSTHFEINFLKDFLLNCNALKQMTLLRCNFDVVNPHEILGDLCANHPNKPMIKIQ